MSTQDEQQTAVATDDEALQFLREQLRAHRDRLQALELQAAKYGDATEPHIVNEIAEIRAQIAPIEAQLIRATPAATRTMLLQARQQAMKAFYSQQWAEAEDLLAQVLQSDPDDGDLQKKLQEAQRHLELGAAYQAICELRAEGLWQAVLGALEDLARQQPDYPDPQGLRQWAEERQRAEQPGGVASSQPPEPALQAPPPSQSVVDQPQVAPPVPLPEQPHAAPPAPLLARAELLSVLERHKATQGYHLTLTPNEVAMIRVRLELLPAEDEVLAYIVTTMFGGLNDGVAFTTRGIAWRNGVMCTPEGASKHGYLAYNRFPGATFAIKPGNNIYLAADQAFNHTGWCPLNSEQILALLDDIKALAAAAPAAST